MADNEINIRTEISELFNMNNNSAVQDGSQHNYNAGKVIFKCLINGYCPFTRDLSELTLVLDSDTLQSFPDYQRHQFGSVPGLPGIYLREIYNYRSNFVVFQDTSNATVTGQIEELQPDSSVIFTNGTPDYKEDQTWKVVPSPVDQKKPMSPSQQQCYWADLPDCDNGTGSSTGSTTGTFDDKYSRATFKYFTPSRASYPNNGQGTSPEPIDSTILAPCQLAVTRPGTKGVHWKFEKTTPLFKGEDFFIEFISIAHQQDLSNSRYTGIQDPTYTFLDADTSYSGSFNGDSVTPPLNYGVVSYRVEDKTFVKDESSSQFFSVHRQSYLFVELDGRNGGGTGSSGDNNPWYFILFPFNFKPTFVKVVGGVSYNLGVYDGASCADLFSRPSFRLAVRNHLGRIVITISGNEGQPWIIENTLPIKGEDKIFRVPDKCKLSIWGGNLPIAFAFAPLQYVESSSFELPPPEKQKTKIEGSDAAITVPVSKPFALPNDKIKAHYFWLSLSDSMPKGLKPKDDTTPGKFGSVVYSNYMGSRHPYYTCDAHKILEASDDGSVSTDINAITFLDTDDQIKDLEEQSGYGNDSYIKLKMVLAEKDNGSSTTDSGVGLEATVTREDESGREVAYRKVNVEMTAGDHTFDSNWKCPYCVTPVMTHLRVVSLPESMDLWDTNEKDVSKHVTHFSDSWTAPDYNVAEHSGSITFLISPDGQNNDNNVVLDQSSYLEGLKDKAFYIEVWAGYTPCSYAHGDMTDAVKLFTGLCYGGTIKQEPVNRTMECKIHDYSSILKEYMFFNSPFFDAVRDINAVYQVMKIAAFKETDEDADLGNGRCNPLYYVKQLVENEDAQVSSIDGRPDFGYKDYILPFSFARLTNPLLRYQDGSKLYDALTDWAKRGSKMMFFDQHGILHWEESSGIAMSYISNNAGLSDNCIWNFVTGKPDDDGTAIPTGQYVFNTMTKEGSVEDIYNNIHVITSTPQMELLIGDEINWPSVEDPTTPGFLGYRRMMFQQEPLFGNQEALEKTMKYYKAFWKAPVVYQFETYGKPVRVFDIASVNGLNIVLTSVSNEIDARENKWWQTLQGEYLQKVNENLDDLINP